MVVCELLSPGHGLLLKPTIECHNETHCLRYYEARKDEIIISNIKLKNLHFLLKGTWTAILL